MAWGVLYFREFEDAGSAAFASLACMVGFYGSAITLIALSKGADDADTGASQVGAQM